ncbi:MAG: hypothetical protein M1376_10905 [Planctomycetes bacterium]|nr:hypothetical protein [Planctomycetota bacterium]
MDLIRNSFESGELAPGMNGRTAALQYPHGCRTLENCVVMIGSGGAERRPGLEIIRETIITPAVPEVPAVPATYKMTYLSECNMIYGIALGDVTAKCYLDAGGVARNVGGGIVGLPFTGHPFAAGETVTVAGTASYNGTFVLQAGTSANELQILEVYAAETFDGTETVIKKITLALPSAGRTVRDSAGNFYYGHNWDAGSGSCLTRIAPDGTTDSTLFTWPAGIELTLSSTCLSLVLDANEQYLYILLSEPNHVIKFDLVTGLSVWATTAIPVIGYELAVDANGNAYTSQNNGAPVIQINADTGAVTQLTAMGQSPEPGHIAFGLVYEVAVDDTLGIVIGGGYMGCLTSEGPTTIAKMYNLGVRTFDDSKGGTYCVGTTYESGTLTYTRRIGTGEIAVYDGFIYVLIPTGATSTEIHKFQWDGSTLNFIDSWAGPAYGTGLFFDLYGNLVVVNQEATGMQTTVFYYYNTNGGALGIPGDLPAGILRYWSAAAGGAWLQGDVNFDGDLGTPGVPGIPAVANDLPVEL